MQPETLLSTRLPIDEGRAHSDRGGRAPTPPVILADGLIYGSWGGLRTGQQVLTQGYHIGQSNTTGLWEKLSCHPKLTSPSEPGPDFFDTSGLGRKLGPWWGYDLGAAAVGFASVSPFFGHS